MENKQFTQALHATMSAHGCSLEEMNLLALSPFERNRRIGQMAHNLQFNAAQDETLDKCVQAKQRFFTDMYQVSKCPFETATNISWEKMFRAARIPDYSFTAKSVFSWFHIAVSSAEFEGKIAHYQTKEDNNPVGVYSYYSGKESVQIANERYIYGEAIIRTERFDHDGVSPFLFLSFPALIIDERLVPQFMEQVNSREVLELLYILFHISSHDGMLHSLFMDSSPRVKQLMLEKPWTSRFLEIHDEDGMFYTYEMNYLRMTRHMFDLCCNENPFLRSGVESLYTSIHVLTKDWPKVLREYFQFIAYNRISRLLMIIPPVPHILYAELSSNNGGTAKLKPTSWEYLLHMMHSNPQREALVYGRDRCPCGFAEIQYHWMARSMLELY